MSTTATAAAAARIGTAKSVTKSELSTTKRIKTEEMETTNLTCTSMTTTTTTTKKVPLKRPLLTDINDSLTCILCGGYFIDATTIIECLHTFCKSCIIKYLDDETNQKACPMCDIPLNKSKPWQSLREDRLRQEIVYKLVPQVYKSEMKRRRDFYIEHKEAEPKSEEDAGLNTTSMMEYFRPSDKISMSLEYSYGDNTKNSFNYGYSTNNVKANSTNADKVTATKSSPYSKTVSSTNSKNENDSKATSDNIDIKNDENDINYGNQPDVPNRRYLLCPAGLPIFQLKKFVYKKYGLTYNGYKVLILYAGEIMADDYTLMDVAYIYSWGRNNPMRFFYRIIERPVKQIKITEATQSISNKQSTETSLPPPTKKVNSGSNNKGNNGTATASNKVAGSKTSTSSPTITKSSRLSVGSNQSTTTSTTTTTPSTSKQKQTISISMKRNASAMSLNDAKPSTTSSNSNKKLKTTNTNVSNISKNSRTYANTSSLSANSSLKPQTSLTDAKLLQFQRATAKAAAAKAASIESNRNKTSIASMKSNTVTSSSRHSINNSNNKPSSLNVNNLIDSMDKNLKPENKNSQLSSQSVTGKGTKTAVETSISSPSSNKFSNEQRKLSLSSATKNNSSTSSLNKSSSSPLSPPAIRIKLTTSPTSNSSTSSKQLYGQIISPIPPEVVNELKKDKEQINKGPIKISITSVTTTSSTTGPRYKTVTSQGVQSTLSPIPNLSETNLSTSSTNSGTRPRGEMIHQIIDKMQSKGSFKSSSVNVTSTTPALDQLFSSASSSSSSKESSPAPSSPQPSSSSANNQAKISTLAIDDHAVGDNKVTTTTGDHSPPTTTSCSTSPTLRSSGNLVLRISTKSLEVATTSGNGKRHNTSLPSTLTSAALSPSSLDSNSSTASSKNSKVQKRSNSLENDTQERLTSPSLVVSSMSSPKPAESTTTMTVTNITTGTSSQIIDLDDDNSNDNLVMDFDDSEPAEESKNDEEQSTKSLTSISVHGGIQSPPQTPSPRSINQDSEPKLPESKSDETKSNNTSSKSSGDKEKCLGSSDKTPNKPKVTTFPLDLTKAKSPSPPIRGQSALTVSISSSSITSSSSSSPSNKNVTGKMKTNNTNTNSTVSSGRVTIKPSKPQATSSAESLQLVNPMTSKNLLITSTTSSNNLISKRFPISTTTSTFGSPFNSKPSTTISSSPNSKESQMKEREIKLRAAAAESYFPINQPPPTAPNSRMSFPPFSPFGAYGNHGNGAFDAMTMLQRNAFSAPNISNQMNIDVAHLAMYNIMAMNREQTTSANNINGNVPFRLGKSRKDRIVPMLPSSSSTSPSGRGQMCINRNNGHSTSSTSSSNNQSGTKQSLNDLFKLAMPNVNKQKTNNSNSSTNSMRNVSNSSAAAVAAVAAASMLGRTQLSSSLMPSASSLGSLSSPPGSSRSMPPSFTTSFHH
ncbi:hypothetical protein RDWZM_002851 [Blomia tropicalis]|uniref:RING-type domain-containing protein n=1 Tax=Blomia tropicalis TaxID=40697 RepID=A0A9Q0RSJ3_BLOTA|nr:hypothetical protein RDWZM_002851 [Blomia tropicalis]